MSAGYSGTPLAKKLGIKERFLVLLIDPPTNFLDLLAPVPADVRFVGMPDDPPWPEHEVGTGFDLIHLFTNSRAKLLMELSESMRHLKPNGSFWVSWYKKAAKLPTEITEDTVREAALPLGLVDVKVCAVDEKWSGLKLVIRRENRI
jgi:hypothetical protein